MGTLTMPDIRWVMEVSSCVVLFWFCFALLRCFCLVELRLFLGLELLCVWHDLSDFWYLLLFAAAEGDTSRTRPGGLRAQFCYLLLVLLCFSFLLVLLFGEHIGHCCRLCIEDGGVDPKVRILDQDGTFGVSGSHRISCGASFGYLFPPCVFW
jgi:hypothetical protein